MQLRMVNQCGGDDYVREAVEVPRTWRGADWGWSVFQKRKHILGSNFVADDTLILELHVEAWLTEVKMWRVTNPYAASAPIAKRDPDAPSSSNSSSKGSQGLGKHDGSLPDHLMELLSRGEGADITIRAVPPGASSSLEAPSADDVEGGTPLRAHRVVLAARSPVFRSMFFGAASEHAGMREAVANEVVLFDTDPKVADWFLHFLYTDRLAPEAKEDDEALCHLMSVAHKYEVSALVAKCEALVAQQLNEENCAERLMMADLLDVDGLRQTALDFMCGSRERLARIQATEAYERLGRQRPQLLVDVLARLVPPESSQKRGVKRDRWQAQAGMRELPSDFETRNVVQLKQLLSDRGLPTSGSKELLLRRLREHAQASMSAVLG